MAGCCDDGGVDAVTLCALLGTFTEADAATVGLANLKFVARSAAGGCVLATDLEGALPSLCDEVEALPAGVAVSVVGVDAAGDCVVSPLTCEAVQDCVGPMLAGVGFVYDDAGNQWDASGAVGEVLTADGVGGAGWVAPAASPAWSGIAGDGVSIVAGGTLGHSPTISARLASNVCNAISFDAGGLFTARKYSGHSESSGGFAGQGQIGTNVTVNNPSTCLPLTIAVSFVIQWGLFSVGAAGGTVNSGGFPVAVGYGYRWTASPVGVWDERTSAAPLRYVIGSLGEATDLVAANVGFFTIPPGGSALFTSEVYSYNQPGRFNAAVCAQSIRVMWVSQ